MRTFVTMLLLVAAATAGASEFGRRFPAGSINDRARAEQALREAEAEEARVAQDSAAREAECYRAFLVNKCREEVRRDRLDAERELRRVKIEAGDLQRKLDAQEAARRRAEAAQRPAEAPQPSDREPRPGRGITPEEAARNRAEYDKRIADHEKQRAEEQARAGERADNAREYREKQAEAERRAKEKDAERRKNEERRAERRRQIELQEAQREEVRRKAEAAARAAGKAP
jgi:hypothetical protein